MTNHPLAPPARPKVAFGQGPDGKECAIKRISMISAPTLSRARRIAAGAGEISLCLAVERSAFSNGFAAAFPE